MDMLTSYGYINKTKYNYRYFDDFNLIVSLYLFFDEGSPLKVVWELSLPLLYRS